MMSGTRLLRGVMHILMLMLFFAGGYATANAQQDTGNFAMHVQLDSFVVKSGFDINAFIRRVQHDTTFYKAFRSMRLVRYTAINDIKSYDKTGNVAATYHSNSSQLLKGKCRTTHISNEETSGNFYKKDGSYNYYTAALYAYLFFTDTPVCNDNDIVAGTEDVRESGTMGKSKYELRQLIFNPGVRISGVPFMGSRESIFDADEARKYDFKVSRDTLDGTECFVFRIVPKAQYVHKTLYDELTTWFRENDYAILARNYSLSYSTLAYDFNVHMRVRTTTIKGKLYPTLINYDGDWHILTKKRERVKFYTKITY